MKLFIVSSSFPVKEFKDLVFESFEKDPELSIQYMVRNKEWFETSWVPYQNRISLVKHERFTNYALFDPFHPFAERIVQYTHEILNDHQTMMLADREKNSFGRGKGASNYVRYITTLIGNITIYLRTEKPDYVYFRTTPHSALEWCIANIAKKIGIPVLVTELSKAPWRHNLFLGFEKERKYCTFKNEITDDGLEIEKQLIEEYFKKNQSDYKAAMPTYESVRLNKNKGKYFNLKNEITKYWKSPDYILNKYKCFKHYSEISVYPEPRESYITFFLHFQPERTSLPEGFGYAQQLIAIQELRMCTPPDIKIFVKEHPATFTNKCDPRQRNPTFYDDVLKLTNVKFVDINIDTFDLLDASVAVSTLTTGSVGRQSLLRGKPIIYFGRTVFDESSGVHKYNNSNDLKGFVNKCVDGVLPKTVIDETKGQFMDSLKSSISGVDHTVPFEKIDIYKRDVTNTAHLRILKAIFDGQAII